MKRSRFWRRFVIPESLSARLLNVIAIGTLGLSVVVMCFAPELQGKPTRCAVREILIVDLNDRRVWTKRNDQTGWKLAI